MSELLASDAETNGLERLGLLASALSGGPLRVASQKISEPAWTDGTTVFIDPAVDAPNRLQALAVQASLLAAGSLAQEVIRKLARRPALTRRYLAVEGHRALAANAPLLPPAVRSLVDSDVAALTDSPAASLAVARQRLEIPDPPQVFGTIHAQSLLAATPRAETSKPKRTSQSTRAEPDTYDEDEAADALDLFSSPVGGGGAIGKLLQRMLGVVRQLGDGGSPGADAPTHRTRSGGRAGATFVFSTDEMGGFDDGADEQRGVTYPEWDVHRRRYRPHWCTVQEVEPRPKAGDTALGLSDAYGLRRPLARLGVGLDRCHRQVQGDDIDIDAAVEAQVEVMAGSAPDEAVYLDSVRRRRDLAVLLLLDVSGSVSEPGAHGQTVHEQQRAAAAAFTVALHDLGDRVALYAFHSQGRSAVTLMPVKRFRDPVDTLVMRRLRGLVPGAYSRLGAAIRHGAMVLEQQGGTSRRLLVVLSDGLAYDHGYERIYGAADARRALSEARQRGTGCLCLTIGASTDAEELRRVFGSAAHATVPRLDQLSAMIGPLFRSALYSAEVRRRTHNSMNAVATEGN
ncbi:MAG TPA: VWA domain-containing protein [Mycobacterium sp.]|nr:VWA domain-containing protein [Mycobacterium sp.]